MNTDAARIWIMTGVRVTHRNKPSTYTFDMLAAEAAKHVAMVAERTADLSYFGATCIAHTFGKRFAADIITHGEADAAALLAKIMK